MWITEGGLIRSARLDGLAGARYLAPVEDVRPIVGAEELELFCAFEYTLNHELADDLAAGRRRPEWMWLALRRGRPVARAAWWGHPEDAEPAVLDVLDIRGGAAIDAGSAMLRTALGRVVGVKATPPDYIRFVPSDWRDHPSSRRVVHGCVEIAERNGARLLAERLRFEWHPGTPVGDRSGSLRFRSVADDDELIDLMTRVLSGTLDAQSQRDLAATVSAREVARQHFAEELARYSSPRGWWRVGMLADGEPVGFVIPAANDYGAIIAYIGVVPAHRGKAYVDPLLAEGTRILAAEGVPRIRASTDVGNVPMAQAFVRAGWHNFERAITMTWT